MSQNFRKVGNWGKATRLANEVGADIKHATGVVMKRVGLEAERKVVKYIQKQPSTWPKLSEEYKQRKISQGYSQLMLRRTGDYINRITSTVSADSSSVFVGVRKGVKNKEGDDLVQIGAVLEYGRKGDARIARPHFRPVNRLMRKKIVEQDMFGMGVYNYIRTKYSV